MATIYDMTDLMTSRDYESEYESESESESESDYESESESVGVAYSHDGMSNIQRYTLISKRVADMVKADKKLHPGAFTIDRVKYALKNIKGELATLKPYIPGPITVFCIKYNSLIKIMKDYMSTMDDVTGGDTSGSFGSTIQTFFQKNRKNRSVRVVLKNTRSGISKVKTRYTVNSSFNIRKTLLIQMPPSWRQKNYKTAMTTIVNCLKDYGCPIPLYPTVGYLPIVSRVMSTIGMRM
jgi:hypothetical protein